MTPSWSAHKRLWAGTLGVFAAWLLFAALVAPALIRSAYRGESLGFLNRLITGQDIHGVETYLATWSTIATRLTLALLALLIIFSAAILFDARGRIGRWSRSFSKREAELKGSPQRALPGSYFVVVLWCGLAAGFWEILYLTKKMVLGEWLAVHMATSSISLWMAPISYAIIFGIAGGVLFAIARLRPGWLSLKWVMFAASFVALYAAFRATAGRLELYGAIPLAAGLALLAARLVAAYSDSFLRFARRSALVGFFLVAALAVAMEAQKRITEHRHLSLLPDAAAGAPNVLLIILDTVRSKSLSLYGYERPTTPNLERLAERSVVFDHAVATAPWTLPTHATVFTGRHHHELTVDWTKPLDDSYPTLAGFLQESGFTTAGFVANFYYCGPQFGLQRGFVHYEHQPIRPIGVFNSSWLGRELLRIRSAAGNHQDVVRKTAADVNGELLAWLDGRDPARPFFAFLNYFDAHSPYLPPEPYNLRFSDTQPRYWLKDEGEEYSEEELAELTDAYDSSIAYLDAQLGDLFDELEAQGILENTVVIVTSDHGEQFGEHRLMYHSNSLYLPLLHVPLLISFPARLPSGIRVEDPVSLRDIASTIVDLLALPASPFPGRSMVGAWAGGDGSREGAEPSIVLSEVTVNRRIPDWMPAAYGPMRSLVDGRYHYIRRGDGAEELFDWIDDPNETTNLVDSETGQTRVHELRARLEAALRPDPYKLERVDR